MTPEEIEKEVKEIYTWTSISGDKVTRMYNLYKLISGDTTTHCNKCPTVIRNIYSKIRDYKIKNYDNKDGEEKK